MEDVYETTITNIIHHVNAAKPSLQQFKNKIANKQVIVCMGNTRSGKSTLVNYLQGNELEAFGDAKRIYIQLKNGNTGPVISHGAVSYTELPSVWEIKLGSDFVIIDVPGFEDNRGPARDIVNTLFFNQLQFAYSVKLVLVVDINDIDTDNIKSFTNVITNLQGIVEDFNQIKGAISVIFTKDCKNYKLEDITAMLKNKIMDVPELDVKKDLIDHLVRNCNSIGILRMPVREGKVAPDDVDYNIKEALLNTAPIIINANRISFTPSEHAHKILLTIYQMYLNQINFATEVEKSVERFKNYFDVDKYVFASTEEELDSTKLQSQFVLIRVTTQITRNSQSIAELQESLNNIVAVSPNLTRRLNFLKSMDGLSLLDENIKNIMLRSYKQALTNLENKINKLIEKIDSEMEDRTKETIQYILSEGMADRAKIVTMGAGLIPIAKKALAVVGVTLPESVTFEVAALTGSGYGLLGAGAAGIAAGGYGVHYYKTIHARCTLRKEQGR